MKLEEIAKRETHLIGLCVDAREASKQFAEAIQFAAEKAEASPAVVTKYIKALANEKANTVAHEASQLSMLFNAMPTVAATPEAT